VVSARILTERVGLVAGHAVAVPGNNEVETDIVSAPAMAPTRILIVDDHEIFRRGLRSLLESHPRWEICGEAVDGQEAVEKVKALKPDIVVLDITMPRLNGLEAARQIRNEFPESKVVILSQHEPSLMKQSALAAGAGAYVTKSEVSKELLVAIESIISEET
jgi:DNA-binding NarL/FixJ family response regulator